MVRDSSKLRIIFVVIIFIMYGSSLLIFLNNYFQFQNLLIVLEGGMARSFGNPRV